jgi:hypothetical protein
MEYYSTEKKNELMSFLGKWLQIIKQNSQAEKDKYHVFFSHSESRPKEKE